MLCGPSVAPESILVYSICCSPVVPNNELKCPIKCSLKFNMVSLKRQGNTHSILEGSALNLMKISVCSLNVKNLLSQQCWIDEEASWHPELQGSTGWKKGMGGWGLRTKLPRGLIICSHPWKKRTPHCRENIEQVNGHNSCIYPGSDRSSETDGVTQSFCIVKELFHRVFLFMGILNLDFCRHRLTGQDVCR